MNPKSRLAEYLQRRRNTEEEPVAMQQILVSTLGDIVGSLQRTFPSKIDFGRRVLAVSDRTVYRVVSVMVEDDGAVQLGLEYVQTDPMVRTP